MGGWVPSLVTDYVSDQMPVHTLLGLKQQAKKVAAERAGTAASAQALASSAAARLRSSQSSPSVNRR